MTNNIRKLNKTLEKKLNEKSIVEEKQKNEIESLQRQIKFYKDKLQIELSMKKSNENKFKKNLNDNELMMEEREDEEVNESQEGSSNEQGKYKNSYSTINQKINKFKFKKRNFSDNTYQKNVAHLPIKHINISTNINNDSQRKTMNSFKSPERNTINVSLI
jgi:hypothetical protein